MIISILIRHASLSVCLPYCVFGCLVIISLKSNPSTSTTTTTTIVQLRLPLSLYFTSPDVDFSTYKTTYILNLEKGNWVIFSGKRRFFHSFLLNRERGGRVARGSLSRRLFSFINTNMYTTVAAAARGAKEKIFLYFHYCRAMLPVCVPTSLNRGSGEFFFFFFFFFF